MTLVCFKYYNINKSAANMKWPKLDLSMQKTCRPVTLGRMWQACRRQLNLEYSPANQFALTQWQEGQTPSTKYYVYRWVLFIGLLAGGIASFACQKLPRNYNGPKVELNYFKWFIYFTNWGYIMLIVQAGLAVAVVHKYRKEKTYNIPCDEDVTLPSSRRAQTPLLCRLYWLSYIIATDLAFVITLVYWGIVYNPEAHELNFLNLLVHAGNTLIMLWELSLNALPVRFAHALYGAGAGLAYGLFSAAYWAAGGTDRVGSPAIYPPLDWNKPGSAVTFVAICAAVMVFTHAFATAMVALRSWSASIKKTDRLTLPTQ